MKVKKETLIFSSGRKWENINWGFIGINSDLEICEGYHRLRFFDPPYGEQPLTQDERTEFADYMILLWKRFENESED